MFVVMGFGEMEPQMNADERRFIVRETISIDHITGYDI